MYSSTLESQSVDDYEDLPNLFGYCLPKTLSQCQSFYIGQFAYSLAVKEYGSVELVHRILPTSPATASCTHWHSAVIITMHGVDLTKFFCTPPSSLFMYKYTGVVQPSQYIACIWVFLELATYSLRLKEGHYSTILPGNSAVGLYTPWYFSSCNDS